MRNKIKQLLNKEEGFTLVELLAVLAILALIVGIAIPMIGGVVKSSEEKANDAQVELIVNAAQLRAAETGVSLNSTQTIKIDDLVKANYLEYDEGNEGKTLTITKDATSGVLTYTVE